MGMRLDQVLVERKLCSSRTEAQELIESGAVLVGGVVCMKQTKQVQESDEITVTDRRRYVSRGGEKLAGAMHDIFLTKEKIEAFCRGKIVLDVGSSTGGFTDFLLQAGVSHVDAVDVGRDQFHLSLRDREEVSLFEQTDIRDFKTGRRYDIIVADLSFISLRQVLPTIISFGTEGLTSYFLLIKPQFEVGFGNTKKGIVKDQVLVEKVLTEVEGDAREAGLQNVHVLPSVIKGGDGNQEFFLYGKL